MQYALIDANTKVIRIQDFAGAPPSLAASKGLQWVPYLSVQNPAYDPATHGLYEAPAKVVFGVLTQQWTVFPLPAEVVAANQAAAVVNARESAKEARAAAVEAIKVTTTAGNTFDGDEQSQTRMARAIIALSTGLAPSVTWVLADNSVIQATAAELTEALVLAGQAQAAVWVI
jgi:hypothetical protein